MVPSDRDRPDDPRARAAQTKRDRTRRALLDAADAIFGSRSWAETRMEDIAAAAGVSAATAYNHFPSKHALVGHVYQPLVRPLVVQAEQDARAGRAAVDALTDQVRALCRLAYRHRRLTATFWAAVVEYTVRADGPADPDDTIDPRTLAPVPDAICLLVDYGQRTGQLRRFPPAREASAMVANLLLMRSLNRPADEPPEATVALLLTVMFGMLRPELVEDVADDRTSHS